MFDWIEEEIAAAKTRNLHRISGPPKNKLRKHIEQSPIPVPPSYKEFVLRFGDSWLYRYLDTDDYYMRIFGGPEHVEEKRTGNPLYYIGWCDSGRAYFRDELLEEEKESPVFESRGVTIQKVADGFEEWVERKRKTIRRAYGKRRWQKLLDGPEPFTEEELSIVAARKKYEWQVNGITKDKLVQFEVTNGSMRKIDSLTIDVRGENFVGEIALPVGNISPGATKVVDVDCYRDLIDPATLTFTLRTEPEPENRKSYWEFGSPLD